MGEVPEQTSPQCGTRRRSDHATYLGVCHALVELCSSLLQALAEQIHHFKSLNAGSAKMKEIVVRVDVVLRNGGKQTSK